MKTNTQTNIGEMSDGYHTFNELYEHRHMLFIALMQSHRNIAWYADKHFDGSSYDDYVLAGINFKEGAEMITYHIPIKHLNLLKASGALHREYGYAHDGHTSSDVITRLEAHIKHY